MSRTANTRTRDLHERIGHIKGINAEKREVSGYASTGEIDRYGEIVSPKAFEHDLARFLDERHIFAAGHQYVNEKGEPTVIGRITEGNIDEKGLFITAAFDTDPLAELWWNKYQSGTLNAFSIGFIPIKHEETESVINGRTVKVRTWTEVELLEISAVPIPANRESIVTNDLTTEQAAELLQRVEALKADQAEFREYVQKALNQILAQSGVLARDLSHLSRAGHGRTGSDEGDSHGIAGLSEVTKFVNSMRK